MYARQRAFILQCSAHVTNHFRPQTRGFKQLQRIDFRDGLIGRWAITGS